MASKKTAWTYGAGLTPKERRDWNRRTDALLRERFALMKQYARVAK